MARTLVLVSCSIPVLLLGASSALVTQSQPNAPPSLSVEQPENWIAFSASVVIKTLGGNQTGAFHRRSDGSTAMMLDTPGGVAITIHNVRNQLTFSKLGTRDWVAHPLSDAALRPPEKSIVLPASRARLLTDRLPGFDVYELTARDGSITQIVPGLNGFLLSSVRSNGLSDEYFDVSIGEPPDRLFEPPTGVPVRYSDVPFGARPLPQRDRRRENH